MLTERCLDLSTIFPLKVMNKWVFEKPDFH